MLTNRKLTDQIKAIERSGQADGRSKEYIMKALIGNTSKYGEKSMEPHKKSIELDQNDRTSIEEIITKIAGVNDISNVSFVTMNLTHNDCVVKFSCEEKKEKKRTEEMGDGAKLEA